MLRGRQGLAFGGGYGRRPVAPISQATWPPTTRQPDTRWMSDLSEPRMNPGGGAKLGFPGPSQSHSQPTPVPGPGHVRCSCPRGTWTRSGAHFRAAAAPSAPASHTSAFTAASVSSAGTSSSHGWAGAAEHGQRSARPRGVPGAGWRKVLAGRPADWQADRAGT